MDRIDDKTTRREFVAGVAATSLVTAGCRAPTQRPPREEERASADAPSLKPIAQLMSARERHWVGDGFAVSTIFSPRLLDPQLLSPFILMDHAPEREFGPTATRRGVGEHPHRGFETVTFAYQGEIDHRDSHGGGGTIGPGDVQWMTAGSGVVHEEKHSRRFSQVGGAFEMVQLWVNLPARLKMTAPRYQALTGASFPSLSFGGASGRLIAGALQGQNGPASSHTPITMFDVTLPASTESSFELALGHTVLVFVLEGEGVAQGEQRVSTGDLLVLDRDAPGRVQLAANSATRLLVLSGEPLGEPVVARGPFVMNTAEEIQQAMQDYRRGLMGRLAPTT